MLKVSEISGSLTNFFLNHGVQIVYDDSLNQYVIGLIRLEEDCGDFYVIIYRADCHYPFDSDDFQIEANKFWQKVLDVHYCDDISEKEVI